MNPVEAVKAFINGLEKLDRSRSIGEKFRDLMELGYCAFAKRAASGNRADQLEARYMSIVNRYSDKDTIRAYPELIALAWETVASGRNDFLGHVSGQIAVLDARNGQFFTPYAVSRLMAELTVDGVDHIIQQRGYITVSEPACGAGGMVLAVADKLEHMGYNPTLHMLVQAIDVSALAYYMAYLQLTWRGLAAAVIRGNTLSLEVFESAWTIGAAAFFDHHGWPGSQEAAFRIETPAPLALPAPAQLKLL